MILYKVVLGMRGKYYSLGAGLIPSSELCLKYKALEITTAKEDTVGIFLGSNVAELLNRYGRLPRVYLARIVPLRRVTKPKKFIIDINLLTTCPGSYKDNLTSNYDETDYEMPNGTVLCKSVLVLDIKRINK